MWRLKLALVLGGILVTGSAWADDLTTIRSASIVLGLTMQLDGDLVVDSEERAHLDGTSTTFEKTGVCTYTGRVRSLGGERYLIVNFNKLTAGFGYSGREIVVIGSTGQRQATCFKYDSAGERCSGALHVPRGVDERLLMTSLHNVQQHGCSDAVY